MTAYTGRTIADYFGYATGVSPVYGPQPIPYEIGVVPLNATSVGYSDEVATPATLTFPTTPVPSYSLTEIKMRKTSVTAFEDGKEQRIRKWDTGRTIYAMRWETLTNAQVDILWAFYESAQGKFRAFVLYDPYDGVTSLGNFRFMQDEMSRDNFVYALWNTGLEVIEVL
jgi:hypothetical protein